MTWTSPRHLTTSSGNLPALSLQEPASHPPFPFGTRQASGQTETVPSTWATSSPAGPGGYAAASKGHRKTSGSWTPMVPSWHPHRCHCLHPAQIRRYAPCGPHSGSEGSKPCMRRDPTWKRRNYWKPSGASTQHRKRRRGRCMTAQKI